MYLLQLPCYVMGSCRVLNVFTKTCNHLFTPVHTCQTPAQMKAPAPGLEYLYRLSPENIFCTFYQLTDSYRKSKQYFSEANFLLYAFCCRKLVWYYNLGVWCVSVVIWGWDQSRKVIISHLCLLLHSAIRSFIIFINSEPKSG